MVNLKCRKVDPDFSLNLLPHMADALTKATGFIFLDTKHGPRYVDYTTPLMAIRMSLIKKGLRYDPEYRGTGYREESDLQERVRKLGYKIVFEPRFYTYHLNLEEGGNRAIQDVAIRFYWKARNNIYFIKKHRLGTWKLIMSTTAITARKEKARIPRPLSNYDHRYFIDISIAEKVKEHALTRKLIMFIQGPLKFTR